MTKAEELAKNMARHMVFDTRPGSAMPKVRNCALNDILLKHIDKLIKFDSETEFGDFLIIAYFEQRFLES